MISSFQTGNISGSQLLILVLVAASAFGGYLYWLSQEGDLDQLINQLETEPKITDIPYTFYSGLRNQTYSGISEQQLDTPSNKKKSVLRKFIIQTGAFKDRGKADQQKAELTLLGIENINIKSSHANNNTLFHVVIGPYSSYSIANARKENMIKQGFDSIVLSMRQ